MKKVVALFSALVVFQITFTQNGPWNDKVYRATSPDGINFTKDTSLLFFPASVPGAVKDTNGTIFIYYVYSASQFSPETVMVAYGTDGKNFTVPQPINLTNNVSLKQVDPNPVLLPDGRIRLYYLDFGMLPPQNIYSAISNDGINFTEENGIRFSQPAPGITDPDVFFVISTNTWVMFVSQGQTLIRATSPDGLNFTKDVTFNWNNGGVCSTFPFGNTYRTYYCGSGGIKSATSTDGYNLTVEAGVRIAPVMNEIVCDPTVVQLNSQHIMYYKSFIMTGIEENDLENTDVEIYPNPFSETATLRITNSRISNAEIKMVDVYGKEIFSESIHSPGSFLIRKEAMADGIYLLRLKSGDKIISKKIIIQK